MGAVEIVAYKRSWGPFFSRAGRNRAAAPPARISAKGDPTLSVCPSTWSTSPLWASTIPRYRSVRRLFMMNQTSRPQIPFQLLEPWIAMKKDDSSCLEKELWRELRTDHPLAGCRNKAVARRVDCDDVLFETDCGQGLLAVVHLTWSGKPESSPQWPATDFFDGWDDFRTRQMMPDHEAYVKA